MERAQRKNTHADDSDPSRLVVSCVSIMGYGSVA